MNTETGTFDWPGDDDTEHPFKMIAVGEMVLVKGCECEVVEIREREILLRLRSAEDRGLEPLNRHERRLTESLGDDVDLAAHRGRLLEKALSTGRNPGTRRL